MVGRLQAADAGIDRLLAPEINEGARAIDPAQR